MQIVTIVQKKGGIGKTSLAMLIASAALARGEKVLMIDADVNSQLSRWKGAYEDSNWGSIEKPEWPENLRIQPLPEPADMTDDDLDALFETFEKESEAGTDLVIIDTRPGSYIDTAEFAAAADVVLIPAEPQTGSFRLVHSTISWMAELEKMTEGPFPVYQVVVSNVPTKMLSAAVTEGGLQTLPIQDQEILHEIFATPTFDTMIPHSQIISRIFHHGPLGTAAEGYGKSRGGKLQERNLRDILEVADHLYAEVKALGYKDE
tara:strand:+ start:615 stop:1400 length:786 start_codon:yes stop_codon:yes gene_type:complete